MLNGTAAVIDKDHAAELLAEEVHADVLLILTAVDYVSINYRQPTQRNLDILTPEQAQTYTSEGHFAPNHAAQGGGRRALCPFRHGSACNHYLAGQGRTGAGGAGRVPW